MKIAAISPKQISNISFKKPNNEINNVPREQEQKQAISTSSKLKREDQSISAQFKNKESQVEQLRGNLEGRDLKEVSAGQGLNQIPKQVQAFSATNNEQQAQTASLSDPTKSNRQSQVSLNSLNQAEAKSKGVELTSSLAPKDEQGIVEEQRAKELKKEELKNSPLLQNQIKKNFPRELKEIKEDLSIANQQKQLSQKALDQEQINQKQSAQNEQKAEEQDQLKARVKAQGQEKEAQSELIQKDSARLDKIKEDAIKKEEIQVKQSREEQEKIRLEEEEKQRKQSQVQKESDIPKTLQAALKKYSTVQEATASSSANEDR